MIHEALPDLATKAAARKLARRRNRRAIEGASTETGADSIFSWLRQWQSADPGCKPDAIGYFADILGD
jgi:hypothetical protein